MRYWLGPETIQQPNQVYPIKYETLRLEPLRVLDDLLRWLGEEVDYEVIVEAVNKQHRRKNAHEGRPRSSG